ncbi:MAG: outer membrane beta-barrel protein [Thermoguttaceae bacterium]
MRLMKLLMTCGILGYMLTATTFAQSPLAAELHQPYNDSYAYFAPSDNGPSAPDAAADKEKKTEAAPEEEKKEEEAAPEEEKAPEPHRLIGQLGCTKINVTGWLDMGLTGNPENPPSRYNGTLAPNDRNEFQFNQLYMVMEKALKTDDCCWDIGGRVDLMYGTDYIYCESLGFETNPDGSPKWNAGIDYGLAMPQIYVDIGYGKMDLKVGRFYTIIGYESMMAISNFFYSMNYAVRYAEPTTHTGGLLTYKHSDEISLFIGGVNGQDETDGLTDSFAALTGFAYTPKDKKYALNFAIMTGGLEPRTADTTTVPYEPHTYFSTYLTYNFNKKWQSVSQWDAGWQQDYNLLGNQAEFWSFTQYLFCTINDCWKAGLRYDMFVDDQGTRLGGLRFGGLPGGNPLPLPSGDAGTVQAITAGLNWTPNPNFRLRPELRWDWYGGSGPHLFDDMTKNGQFAIACDGIIQF